ncbi:uncharacterized protein LOC115678424 isoform X2 [Syzygium oleosum]|uniref:uncharacterized protein LOC115678424 isoform X2 n=1 Tax=Syzygium oleosum TaxID=219896 RepID=UPI0024B99108|nr:uncharacterized protein LOC115678424 isoform X2 [Syzygium oleosum]
MRRGVDFGETGSSLSCLGPWTIDEEFCDDDDGDDEGGEGGREVVARVGCVRSYSYYRLPRHLLKLSILKLDGSVFDVHVERNATVAALKQALEDVFSSSPKDGLGKISWSHVWGHFCLSFDGEKLLNDRAYLRSFRINDGDQLCFIRHLSTNYSPMKRQPKNQNVSRRQHQMLPPYSNDCKVAAAENSADDADDWDYFKYNNREDHEIPMPEFSCSRHSGFYGDDSSSSLRFLKSWMTRFNHEWGSEIML